MRNEKKIAVIMEQVKEMTAHMAQGEKEAFRDELLSWLLFGESHQQPSSSTENHPMKGLNEEEKQLIRKLAEKTEALYRITKRVEDSDCD